MKTIDAIILYTWNSLTSHKYISILRMHNLYNNIIRIFLYMKGIFINEIELTVTGK